jgi:23S rRNA C2498 (ribose-2'-O)-methylase RlmM
MIILSPLVFLSYLLATSNNGNRVTGGRGRGEVTRSDRGRGSGRGSGRGGGADRNGRGGGGGGRGDLGRKRYNREGSKKRSSGNDSEMREELSPLPPLTKPNGPRPFYFTCRHTYENTLIDEINRYAKQLGGQVIATSPYPGLVRVEDDDGLLPTFYDPVYALQSMPQGVVVSAESIKGIAKEVISALLGNDGDDSKVDETSAKQKERLRTAQRGSLTIHSLVPGMCKGQTKPVMQHRSEKVGEEIGKMMKKMFPAARKAAVDYEGNIIYPSERWIIQMMLQSPNIVVASLVECQKSGPGRNAYWPNHLHPLGLAKVDIEEKMPSSAYRKLMEGLECMGISPTSTTTVVDLGASPGGWTGVMRRLGCYVVAVDRSQLDPALMRDEMVEFVKGDAFTFEPAMVGEGRDCWMISDVIAYPERCTELLNRWCEGKWASNMIVTMKFQGDEPDLDELDSAIQVVESHNYDCRVKHFFNNKNEVTFMVSEKAGSPLDLDVGILGSAMFPITL